MSERYKLTQDLQEAEAMAKELPRYIPQDAVYGNVGGGGFFNFSQMPKLTLGALWMRQRRLRALYDQLTPAQQNQLETIEQLHKEALNEAGAQYERKLVREANSRLDAMTTFFEECNADPKLCPRVYKPEAARRTIVQEIMLAMQALGLEDADLNRKIAGTDGKLRRYTKPTDFIWDAALKDIYPQSDFWWLYQAPPQQEN